jgi:tetratricopeptide (TPR) repeat protein
MTQTRTRILLAALLLAGLAVIAYLPALHGGFLFDDDALLTRNPLIRAPDGLYRFWFTSEPVDYWPVTMSSLWVEWRLWGMDPAGYHVTNLLLHIGSALLLWAILKRLRVPGAYWAALLFAVHPVNAQSVAWIAQRKNTLSMIFFLASIYCFLRTRWSALTPTRSSGPRVEQARWGQRAPPQDVLWYGLSLLAFILAMLSKGSVAILPLVLLGIVAWRRRLERGDLIRAVPFFAVAAALTWVNIQFQNHGATNPIRTAGPVERVLEAGATVWFYLSKALLPVNLAFFYPLWHIRIDEIKWWVPVVMAIGLTVWLWRRARLRARGGCDGANAALMRGHSVAAVDGRGIWRGTLFAWGYFCVALIPVMGFADIYFMKYSLVADHYQYLALIAVLAWVSAVWWGGAAAKLGQVRFIAAGAVVALLTGLTWRQTHLYRDAETLYRISLRQNPDCWPAENNLGIIANEASQPVAAFAHFARALDLNPDFAEAHYNLGRLLKLMPDGAGRALPHFTRAVELNPRFGDARYWLAECLEDLGRTHEAVIQFEAAIRLHTNFLFQTQNDLGVTLANAGQLAAALPHFEEAVRLNPRVASVQLMLAEDLGQLGRTQEAQAHYQEALRLDPRLGRPSASP